MTSPTPPAHLPESRLAEIEARIAKATPVHVMTLVRAIQGAEREEYRAAQVFDAGPSMAADATHLSAIGACWATREAVEDLVAWLVADSSALVLAVRAARAENERMRPIVDELSAIGTMSAAGAPIRDLIERARKALESPSLSLPEAATTDE